MLTLTRITSRTTSGKLPETIEASLEQISIFTSLQNQNT